MEVQDAIRSRRSIRRFQNRAVSEAVLLELVDLARLSPSAGNRQPIRYCIVTAEEERNIVFSHLRWAMFLSDFEIPPEQRPQAYILLLSQEQNCQFDAGAAAMALMLAAKGYGLDSCCLGVAAPQALVEALGLSPTFQTAVAIALGYGQQRSEIVPMKDTFRYSQTKTGDILVPKRSLPDCLAECHGR